MPLEIYIISQVIGVFTVFVFTFGMFQKVKTGALKYLAIAMALTAVNRFLLADFLGMALAVIATTRNVVFYVLARRGGVPARLSLGTLVFFMVADIVVVSILWWTWFNWIVLSSVLFISYCNWSKSMHLTRLGSAVYSVAFIIHNAMFFNISNIIINIIVIVAIGAFYIKFLLKKRFEDLQCRLYGICTVAQLNYAKIRK